MAATTLTFKLSDATTQTLAADPNITPQDQIRDIRGMGGFFAGGDRTGNTPGAVWVNYEQVVSITIS